MDIKVLGPCQYANPLPSGRFFDAADRILVDADLPSLRQAIGDGDDPPTYQLAGPRRRIFFDPATTSAAIVTCGGLCPGINDVIRAIYMQLWHGYGVRRILGLRYGYEGLNPACGHEPLILDWDEVDDIHQMGGSILSSSRGPQDPAVMVDYLVEQDIDILFAIGGDGTQRGAQAIHEEIEQRGLPISIIGIPKSIDNDISCIERTFGFHTAVSAAQTAIVAAHNEAKGAPNGIGIVKLMGRHSGFIAAHATLAFSEVNLTLVPEVPFQLFGEGQVLDYLEDRLHRRQHAVIVVAEGAGQNLFDDPTTSKDASGNDKLKDIGLLLKDVIKDELGRRGLEASLKYIDPSYMIRGIPATPADSVYCLTLGQRAADAGMAGCTGMLVGTWHNHVTHVPLTQATAKRKVLDPQSLIWQSVLHATGQPDWGRQVDASD